MLWIAVWFHVQSIIRSEESLLPVVWLIETAGKTQHTTRPYLWSQLLVPFLRLQNTNEPYPLILVFPNTQPGPPSKAMFTAVVGILAVYSVLGGYLAGTQPTGAGWRLFSVRYTNWFFLGGGGTELPGYQDTTSDVELLFCGPPLDQCYLRPNQLAHYYQHYCSFSQLLICVWFSFSHSFSLPLST